MAALTLFTGSFTVRVPGLQARLSVSETFIFTAVLLFGPAAGTIIVVLDALVISFWLDRMRRSPLKVLFNGTAPAIAIRLASEAFFYLSGAHPGQIGRHDISQLITPVFAFIFLYFIINTGLVAGALAVERRERVVRLWANNFPGTSINYFVGGSLAMLIVAYTDQIDVTVLSIIIPLLLISYYTFRSTLGRVEDANRHVVQLNDLYMSTIEALAMAVDAKDQITHGHIRRVQVFAVELAKRLGVTEERQLQAITTAALLHDMGKLAIPEHILNKPGKLSAAEFEKMKRHADIGADLLSSVRFPYPVVPIVRHHHECWDGTGYPTGISGTDIPLGARILSVVDCFDALTSDRPYRPRLGTDEAFAIIRQSRGTMYDPFVVDTFINAYEEIAPVAIQAGQDARSIIDAAGLTTSIDDTAAPLRHIRANASETTLLDTCSRDIARATSTATALQSAGHYLRQLTPATIYAVFVYNSTADILTCVSAYGDNQHLLDNLSIKLGERITGWTAANRRASVNSDASLDLAQIAGFFAPPLRSTLSTPLVQGDSLMGVLTAYSAKKDAFNEGHRYTFEHVGSALASRISSLVANTSSNVVSFPNQKA
ncbi:MAG: HD domain-containing protein [Acidobacteria bacterium]|nr:HD domain-containing protein [Acidobacteriota bacterium]